MSSIIPEHADDNRPSPPPTPSSNDVVSSPMLSGDSLRRIKNMVLLQANLNSPDEDGHTPLTRALKAKDATKAQLLLEHNADPNLANLTGETPLYLVVCQGFLRGVKLLLKHRADPNLPTLDGETPIYGAAANGHVACVGCLLQNGANADSVTKTTKETPIYGAASHGHAVCLKLLIEHGADVYKPNHKGMTPLMGAARKSRLDYIESFFYIADEESLLNVYKSDSRISRPQSRISDDVLRFAIEPCDGYEECVKLLAEHQSEIAKDIDSDQTPLVWAARSGNFSWLEIFLDKGADPNKEAPNGDTALFWAAERGHVACVRLLIDHGADVNQATRNGETPLFAAARVGDAALVDMLLEDGADPNADSTEIANSSLPSSSQHSTAVGPGRKHHRIQALHHDSNPDTAGLLPKQTPLYIAAKLGHSDCVEMLLAHHADPDLFTKRDDDHPAGGVSCRDTPLIAAVCRQHVDCVDILLERALPEACTRSGRIPLKIALELRNEAIVELLLSRGPVSNVRFFEDNEFSKRLCKDCRPPFLLDLVASKDLPWGAKQYILERVMKDTNHENVLLEFIHAGLEDLSDKSIEHQTIFLLMMDFYVYSAWIMAFAFSAFHALAEEMERRATTPILAMLVLTFYFIGRELFELRRSGKRYVRDVWNWVDLGAIALVMATGLRLLGGANVVENGKGSNLSFQRTIMSAGALLTLSFVGYLKTTFLPFSNFVGGVMEILWDLFPFGIVNAIVLVAFSFMYYVKHYGEEGFETFKDSFYSVFTRFVGDFDDANDVLDLAFGVVSIMVLLNVLVAIVSTSWENAVNKSLILLCRHRLELLQQVDAIIPSKGFSSFRIIPKDYDEDYNAFVEDKIFSRIRPFSDKNEQASLLDDKTDDDDGQWQHHILWYVIYLPVRAAVVVIPWLLGAITFGLFWPKHIREALFSIVPEDKELSSINNTGTRAVTGRTSIVRRRRTTIARTSSDINGEKLDPLRRIQLGNEMKNAVEEMRDLIDNLKSDGKHKNSNLVANLIDAKVVRIEKQISSVQDEVKLMNEGIQRMNQEMNARQDRLESLIGQLLEKQNATETQSTQSARTQSLRGPEVESEPLRPRLLDHGISYRST